LVQHTSNSASALHQKGRRADDAPVFVQESGHYVEVQNAVPWRYPAADMDMILSLDRAIMSLDEKQTAQFSALLKPPADPPGAENVGWGSG
jgi:hypothetical protein